MFGIKRRLEPDVWKRTSPVLRGERVREDSDLPDLNNNHDMIKRSLYYWGRLYTSQLQKGMPYSSLHKT
ncbi:PD-(D/E)XK nuclease family transposase, partial [Bacillus mycoides]|nr:PD-(D/E)XK nuclease family transposase [Bacillus mycoides]